ncbi:MAG: glucose/sorbosone dehydrogenase-like protein [Chloroflexi bacterium OLB14]|nr:MAG: glucose/sorbosone dehydrogenase-like protein [Chloroflexi bacterium OLB14]
MLACGRFSDLVAPTITPLAPPTVASAPSTEIQLATSVPPTQTSITNTNAFPNASDYQWTPIINDLDRPVDVQSAFDGSGRLFIIEKYGAIRVYQNGQLLDEPFLNIDDRVDDWSNEMGLLGLAFHPNFEQNGFFYVNYTGDGGHTRISRFTANGNTADPNTEKILMVIDQPYPNHNGGAVAFGPDGYLYLGLGDGGLAGDPHKNGQNKNSLLGKILRIDVNNGDPYSIPSDNPFGNEVWAYGLRNPWRISFDSVSGDLWIGDVGQGEKEEIDYLPAGSAGGANFGWSIMEGSIGYDSDPQPDLLLPVAEYSHSDPYEGCSVTGGYVYRGSMPEWNGIYFYADYCTGYVWGLFLSNGQWQNQRLFETEITITSFGQGQNGEIYLASDNGSVYTLTRK